MDQTKQSGDHGRREHAVAGIVLIALGVFAVAVVGARVIIAATGGATG
jgi:L-serine deaminase